MDLCLEKILVILRATLEAGTEAQRSEDRLAVQTQPGEVDMLR